jgi:hypothetical protein
VRAFSDWSAPDHRKNKNRNSEPLKNFKFQVSEADNSESSKVDDLSAGKLTPPTLLVKWSGSKGEVVLEDNADEYELNMLSRALFALENEEAPRHFGDWMRKERREQETRNQNTNTSPP